MLATGKTTHTPRDSPGVQCRDESWSVFIYCTLANGVALNLFCDFVIHFRIFWILDLEFSVFAILDFEILDFAIMNFGILTCDFGF